MEKRLNYITWIQTFNLHKNRRYLLRHCKNVETRFDNSSYELDRPLRKKNNKKVIGLMKDESGQK